MFVFFNARKSKKMKIENNYQSIDNDVLQSRIYTLENGLKVYLTRYNDAPRIQTNIAVRAGSKNDPPHATGLAHYLEHMLFKGTDLFGTVNYEEEKPILDKIEVLYEEYRECNSEDAFLKQKIWDEIDSLSGLAANFAIANEYDKIVAGFGSKGTNAYTSFEKTVYVNDIPSNQLEKWVKLESERFRNPVFRGFHTELETVYEEKNMSLDNDMWKVYEQLLSGLFPNHQYGQQTTIGTIEHLKNPSLKEIRKYFDTYYVPNNMAICLSGDLEFDKTIKIIEKYWGSEKFLKKKNPKFDVFQENQIEDIIEKEVYGPQAEVVYLGFRFDGAGSKESLLLTMVDMILSNNTAGLIDLNLNQKQKIIGGGCFPQILKDYSFHAFYGTPKKGQSLLEVKNLLLSQIEEVKQGNFPEWLVDAIINDLKISRIKKYESNVTRANEFVESFILDIPWKDYLAEINDLEKITKQDIINFVKSSYLDNYVVVYKKNGEDKSALKVEKPKITPIPIDRESQSEFSKNIEKTKVAEISPIFLDYDEDITKSKVGFVDLFYRKNNENERFMLEYVFELGTDYDKRLKLAVDYSKFLGTDKYTSIQIKEQFYSLGCDLKINCDSDNVKFNLTGLSINFQESVKLLEHILNSSVGNNDALIDLKSTIYKTRLNAKLDQRKIRLAMLNYAKYGKESSFTNVLSNKELDKVTSDDLLNLFLSIKNYEHFVTYYGPESIFDVRSDLIKLHINNKNLLKINSVQVFPELNMLSPKIYLIDYDMKQSEILIVSKGKKLSVDDIPVISFHNQYFGGGMSSIIFQELRESRALAYSVYSTYTIPNKLDQSHYSLSYIGTQSDKLPEALEGIINLLNNLPESQENIEIAKESIEQKIRTERITKSNILAEYIKARKIGVDYDIRKTIYDNIESLKVSDLMKFHNTHIKSDSRVITILGPLKELDLDILSEYGKIINLTLEDVFGY